MMNKVFLTFLGFNFFKLNNSTSLQVNIENKQQMQKKKIRLILFYFDQ